jgi:glycosyltransferase involved in cell wall biosynthesis
MDARKLNLAPHAIDERPLVSIVLPAYNEEANLPALYQEITAALERYGYDAEIIFVDDGSRDGTFGVMEDLHAKDPRVRVVKLQGNQGKSAAYSAGFDIATGRYVLTMDSDLQDDPSEMNKFVEKLETGIDFVTGWKHKGKGPSHKRIPSKIFNIVLKRFTKLELHDNDCPFRGMKQEVARSLKLYGELYRYIPLQVKSRGFTIAEVPIENRPRVAGQSQFGVERYLRGALDLFTMLFITRYLSRPLHLFGGVGLAFAAIGSSIVVGLYLLKFLFGILINNTPYLFATGILATILGVQLFSLGLVCQLILELHKQPGDGYRVQLLLD